MSIVAMERAQALVIEDSPEITLLVRGLLEKEGYAVVATPRGGQGLEWARANKPELVILDLSLPDRDGVEVCRDLRGFSDAYVVMVTARDDEVDKIVGLTVGADDYVTKPFSPRELAPASARCAGAPVPGPSRSRATSAGSSSTRSRAR